MKRFLQIVGRVAMIGLGGKVAVMWSAGPAAATCGSGC